MGGRCIRKWLWHITVVLFMSYMCILVYILLSTSSAVEVKEIFQVPVIDNQRNDSKNWHFEPGGHEHFHQEQERVRKEQERLRKERIRKEREKARKESAEKMFLSLSAKDLFRMWAKNRKQLADCSIEVFDSKVVVLHNVTLTASKATAQARGGEKVKDVMNRKDEDEMYDIKPGFFKVPGIRRNSSHCGVLLQGHAPHLLMWTKAVEPHKPMRDVEYDKSVTVLITRYEYANVYWAVMDLYDVYLTTVFLNQTMNTTHVLIVDAHPFTPLDELWQGVFKNVSRPHQLSPVSAHRTLAWTFGREFSPMLNKGSNLPLIREFRDSILQSFNVSMSHQPNCKSLNVLFIWRRNYVAHPRNPEGIIARKISNENDLLSAAKRHFPRYNIQGVQLDALPMPEQLGLLSQTDIFIGMHGAAFGFTVLLPTTSAVIEMFPYGVTSNWHMEYLAKKSGHHYYTWKNGNKTLEDVKNKYTKVPPEIVTDLLSKATNKICHAHQRMEHNAQVPKPKQ